ARDGVDDLIPRGLGESTNRIKPAATAAAGTTLKHTTTERHGGWGVHRPVNVIRVVTSTGVEAEAASAVSDDLAILDLAGESRAVDQLHRVRIGRRDIVGESQLRRVGAKRARPCEVGRQTTPVIIVRIAKTRGHDHLWVLLANDVNHRAHHPAVRKCLRWEADNPSARVGLTQPLALLVAQPGLTELATARRPVHPLNGGGATNSPRPLRPHNRLTTRQRETTTRRRVEIVHIPARGVARQDTTLGVGRDRPQLVELLILQPHETRDGIPCPADTVIENGFHNELDGLTGNIANAIPGFLNRVNRGTEPTLDLIQALAELMENVSPNPVADHLQDIGHILPAVANPLENRLNNIIVKRGQRILQRVPRGANNVFPHPLNAIGHSLPTGLNSIENRHENTIPHELGSSLKRVPRRPS